MTATAAFTRQVPPCLCLSGKRAVGVAAALRLSAFVIAVVVTALSQSSTFWTKHRFTAMHTSGTWLLSSRSSLPLLLLLLLVLLLLMLLLQLLVLVLLPVMLLVLVLVLAPVLSPEDVHA